MIVEKETRLNYPLQDGSTKRKHLESIARQTGTKPEELIIPELHSSLYYIKYIFDELSMTRKYNNGPQMLEQADIYYWGKLHDTKLTKRELRLIQKLDIVQVNSIVTCMKEQN